MNMQKFRDIGDDEIRVVKCDVSCEPRHPKRLHRLIYVILFAGAFVAIIIVVCIVCCNSNNVDAIEQESVCRVDATATENISVNGNDEGVTQNASSLRSGETQTLMSATAGGYTLLADTVINDVPLRLYIPCNAEMSLHIGAVDKNDSTIVYVARAADVRADNGKIVGAFVLKGEPIAKGLSKRGYCASIDGRVVVGVADNSPLFEEAVEKNGYFFRQYALVDNGSPVENEPKGKAVRRAICARKGEVFMVESSVRESFHDFANALVDMGVENAVYLVGSSAYGWAVDENGVRHEFGDENTCSGSKKVTENINYIVWRKK